MASAVSNTFSGTGDIQNNLSKLLREVNRMKLQIELSVRSLTIGLPSAFLPILHAAFMTYSLPLARYLVSNGIELYGKNDFRFLDLMFKALREVFHYYPKLTREQFLSSGYTERKLILTTDILLLCQAKHRELSSLDREGEEAAAGRGKGRRGGRSRGRRRRRAHGVQASPVVDVQGSGIVQREVPTIHSTIKDIHLPLSPPPSPRHATPSPAVIRGPEFLLPDADLAATPVRTTASPTSLITSSSAHDHPNLAEVDIGPILARARDKEGLSAQYIDALAEQLAPLKAHTDKKEAVIRLYMEGGPSKKKGKCSSRDKNLAKASQGSQKSCQSDISVEEAFPPLMQEMCYQLDQVRLMLEKMAVRVALLEIQVKKLEGSSTVQWAKSEDSSITKNDLLSRRAQSSSNSSSALTSSHLTTPGSADSHSSTTQSPITPSPPPLVTKTPDDTRQVIDNLRHRARKARELLSNANGTLANNTQS